MKLLLWPFARVYGCIIMLRNFLFNIGILPQKEFDFPVICIGNLKTGGTGKSPHVFYLANQLKSKYKVAILSRGYGRISKGFRFVNSNDSASLVGDEPLQYAQLLPEVTVSVCEKRVEGIEQIILKNGKPDVLILDDAYQHRYVKAGFNVLLTEYNVLYIDDDLLPAGRLREPISSAKRASCIIVTKCPPSITNAEMEKIRVRLNPLSNQHLFFSFIRYNDVLTGNDQKKILIGDLKNKCILLLTGIANSTSLNNFLLENCFKLEEVKFPDHHIFTVADMVQLRKKFDMFANANINTEILIITTRKDEMRLQKPELKMLIKDLPISVIDIDINFVGNQSVEFNQIIKNYVESY